MSVLLKDRVWSMEAPTAKRGVYPLHGFKLGLYRLPITLEDPDEIKSVHDGLKKAFEIKENRSFFMKGLQQQTENRASIM